MIIPFQADISDLEYPRRNLAKGGFDSDSTLLFAFFSNPYSTFLSLLRLERVQFVSSRFFKILLHVETRFRGFPNHTDKRGKMGHTSNQNARCEKITELKLASDSRRSPTSLYVKGLELCHSL